MPRFRPRHHLTLTKSGRIKARILTAALDEIRRVDGSRQKLGGYIVPRSLGDTDYSIEHFEECDGPETDREAATLHSRVTRGFRVKLKGGELVGTIYLGRPIAYGEPYELRLVRA